MAFGFFGLDFFHYVLESHKVRHSGAKLTHGDTSVEHGVVGVG